MTRDEESAALHERVRRFAADPAAREEDFDQLALAIADFQRRHIPGYARLVEAHGTNLDRVDAIPAVPTDVFRLTRVAVHEPAADVARFVTSGTTAAPGVHPLRTTETYRQLALRSGEAALASAWSGPRLVVALAPPPESPPRSSLAYMMQLFMTAWDGRALVREPLGAAFAPLAPERWLASPAGIDLAGLRRAAALASERQEPLLVLATAFSLVNLLDQLGGARLTAPRRTVVMVTGGFKGRSRELAPAHLREAVAAAFGVAAAQVVGEYGMTELTSQLYEGTLPGGGLRGRAGVFHPPPWLRVTPVDPCTLQPVALGATGLARFIDLGNVDSAVAVLTEDLVRRCGEGIELMGRRRAAVPRGCSLAFEALVAPTSEVPGTGVGGIA